MYRVVQWATGNLGRAAVQAIASHPELELVGVHVYSESKAGRDAGEVCGLPANGIVTSNEIQAVLDLAPDCVIYSPLVGKRDEVAQLLRAGVNVVTPLNWFYPQPHEVEDLAKACREGEATLHGTGIHPGGMTERLPLVLSAFSREIRSVRSEEYSDCRSYGAPDVLRDLMLFGSTAEEAAASPMIGILGGGFAQSIRMVADVLGFELDDEIRTRHDIGLAIVPIETPMGIIEPGRLAAQRFSWEGCVGGRPVVTARVNWYMGADGFDAPWLDRSEGERYEIEIEGDPPVRVKLHGVHPDASSTLEEVQKRNPGMVATANHCVSAVPYVCAAEAGVKTYLDLPLVAGRAAPC